MTRVQLGRYGENPHQKAWSERGEGFAGPTVLNPPLHGKPLGYNNYLDANTALDVMLDLSDRPSAVVIKHQNPLIAACSSLPEAFKNAWLGDEISAFGSIVGYNQPVDLDTIKLLDGKFVEVVVAPSFADEALAWIKSQSTKTDLRVIATGPLEGEETLEERTIRGGRLYQTRDNKLYLCETASQLLNPAQELTEPNSGIKYQVGTVTREEFQSSMEGLIEFAIINGKHAKSNAIVLAYEYAPGQYRTLGLGAGQMNRLDAVRKLAVPKAKENLMRQYFREKGLDYTITMDRIVHDPEYRENLSREINAYTREILTSNRVVLFSDAFFPKRDGLVAAAETGVRYIIAPGGSNKDLDVIAAANQEGVAMIFTGIRHFKH